MLIVEMKENQHYYKGTPTFSAPRAPESKIKSASRREADTYLGAT